MLNRARAIGYVLFSSVRFEGVLLFACMTCRVNVQGVLEPPQLPDEAEGLFSRLVTSALGLAFSAPKLIE